MRDLTLDELVSVYGAGDSPTPPTTHCPPPRGSKGKGSRNKGSKGKGSKNKGSKKKGSKGRKGSKHRGY